MKRNTVYLENHQKEWEDTAEKTIDVLRMILQDDAMDIQHIGSTSIRSIPAKPIIDIAVAITDYDAVMSKQEKLEKAGIIFRLDERPEQLLFVIGDFEKDTRSHHIHVVLYDSPQWRNYLNFRDYLNTDRKAAEKYADKKRELSERFPNDRDAYTNGKSELIADLLAEALKWRNKNE